MSYGGRRGKRPLEKPWIPRTSLGKQVADGVVTSMQEVYGRGARILEPEIVKKLLPKLTPEVVEVGIVKKQTDAGPQRRFRAIVAVGEQDGWFGVGEGKDAQRLAAVEKATKAAMLSVVPVQRDAANRTILSKTSGKVGSVTIELSPAARGTGIVAGPALKRLLALAGIKDVYVKTFGSTRTSSSLAGAAYEALRKSYGLSV